MAANGFEKVDVIYLMPMTNSTYRIIRTFQFSTTVGMT